MAKKVSGETGVSRLLEDIKRLLIYILIKSGGNQDDIADALGVNQSTISRMFPNKVRAKKSAKKGVKKGVTKGVTKGVRMSSRTGTTRATRVGGRTRPDRR